MKKISVKNFLSKFQLVLVRFPFTLLFIIGLSVLAFLKVNEVKVEIQDKVWLFFILGTLLNISVTLCLEEFKSSIVRYLFNIVPSVLLGIYCYFLPDKLNEYQSIQLFVLGVVFALSAFFVSFLKKENDQPFWNFSRDSIVQLIISYFFASVLMSGISLALLSVNELFHINIDNKVYANISIICFLLFAPVYFLSNLPDEYEKRNQKVTFQNIFKIFGLYILLPILFAYLVILYVYFFQIIIKWELPNGWVTTLVSVLALGGFLCMLILHPLYLTSENKAVNLLTRYLPLLLFPLIVLMSVGIYRRITDYGITINRAYIVLLNLWLYGICHYLFYSKARHVKWILISFTLVLFFSSVGPWSVFSITRRVLVSDLKQTFSEANILENAKIPLAIKPTFQPDTLSQRKIVSSLKYLQQTYGKVSLQPLFAYSIENKSLADIFKTLHVKDIFDKEDIHYFSAYIPSDSKLIDIHEYQYMLDVSISEYNDILYDDVKLKVIYDRSLFKISVNNLKTVLLEIDLKSKLEQINAKVQSDTKYEFNKEDLTIKGQGYMLIIQSVTGRYNADKKQFSNIECSANLYYSLP